MALGTSRAPPAPDNGAWGATSIERGPGFRGQGRCGGFRRVFNALISFRPRHWRWFPRKFHRRPFTEAGAAWRRRFRMISHGTRDATRTAWKHKGPARETPPPGRCAVEPIRERQAASGYAWTVDGADASRTAPTAHPRRLGSTLPATIATASPCVRVRQSSGSRETSRAVIQLGTPPAKGRTGQSAHSVAGQAETCCRHVPADWSS